MSSAPLVGLRVAVDPTKIACIIAARGRDFAPAPAFRPREYATCFFLFVMFLPFTVRKPVNQALCISSEP